MDNSRLATICPTKAVGPPWTPLPARKSKGVLEKVLDDADAVIDGNWPNGDLLQRTLAALKQNLLSELGFGMPKLVARHRAARSG